MIDLFALRLKELREKRGLSQKAFALKLGISQSTVGMWESKKREPNFKTTEKIATFFNVTTDYLLGRTDKPSLSDISLPQPNITEDYTTFPVIGDIAAGYDHIAVESWEGDTIDIPNSYLRGHQKSDFFVLTVRGDSMYPIYQEGDKVLILKQSTLMASGDIGAVIYDDEIATIKKVEFVKGEDWLRLVPLNPNFKPEEIRDERLEHCRVIGVPRLLIREVG